MTWETCWEAPRHGSRTRSALQLVYIGFHTFPDERLRQRDSVQKLL